MPARLLPCSWRRLGVLSWQGQTPALGTGCIPRSVRSKAVTPSLPSAAKPPEQGLAWQQVLGFHTAPLQEGSSLRNCLLTLHTAFLGEKQLGSQLGHDGDFWSRGEGPWQMHHEEGSICCVPWDGVSMLHKAGSERLQVCVQRQAQAVCAQSIPKTSDITVASRPGLLQPTRASNRLETVI